MARGRSTKSSRLQGGFGPVGCQQITLSLDLDSLVSQSYGAKSCATAYLSLGVMVQDVMFRDKGLGFDVQILRSTVEGLGLRVWGSDFRVQG